MNNLLASDHSELDEMLRELFSALETGDVEESFKKLDVLWARLAMHIRAEHLHLFPAILRIFDLDGETIKMKSLTPSLETAQNAIKQLRDDHDFFMHELAFAIKQMREMRKKDIQNISKQLSEVHQKVIAVSRRLEAHNELEESEVYRWADTLLNSAERAALNEKMQKELDNLPPRFDNL
ncbi:MAG TPA: hypothetical protein VK892_09900 [Pyrinomonadaceae bacterium]|nr:hypothetical protein [Pyrinomonadaceae bacterium]